MIYLQQEITKTHGHWYSEKDSKQKLKKLNSVAFGPQANYTD
jgi:hypothetical protein